ncbi:MAG: hypothetical protein ACYTHJ_01335 [Planctomycetota bacterium]|jgi:predicted amidophosphoribosyltransferase
MTNIIILLAVIMMIAGLLSLALATHQQERGTRACHGCRTENPWFANYCGQCGRKLTSPK